MANERKLQTQIPERRLVMPELGSRYQPRSVRKVFSDVASHQQPTARPIETPVVTTAKPAPSPSVAAPAPVVTPRQAPAQTATRFRSDVVRPAKVKQQRSTPVTTPALPRQHKSLVLKRQISVKAEQHQKLAKKERRQQLKAFVLGSIVAAIVAGVGAGFVIVGRNTQGSVDDQAQISAALGASTSGPTETPVTAEVISTYTVASDQPRILRIPRIGLQARIMPVAVGQMGEPQNTGNIYDIGWLQTSAKPGNGMTVLNGFTVGPTKPGALNGMTNLLVGDVIEIEKGDGTKASYKVVKTHNYPSDKVDMQAVKTAPDVSGRGLSIMANVGRFNVRTNQFEDRAVVWAVQL